MEPCLEDMQFMESKNEVIEPQIALEICCENKDAEQPRTFFLEYEALFNMRGLLDSMAEGLILTPPRRGFDWDDLGCYLDLTLWTD